MEKAKALFDSEHIINVKEVRKPGALTEISGFCIRQASVTERAYGIFWCSECLPIGPAKWQIKAGNVSYLILCTN